MTTTNTIRTALRTATHSINGTHVVTWSGCELTIHGPASSNLMYTTTGLRGVTHGIATIEGDQVEIARCSSLEAARAELASRRADTARRVAWVESLDL